MQRIKKFVTVNPMSLELSLRVEDQCTTLILSGSLNEYSSALDKVDVNPQYDLNLDLKNLAVINSVGIRNFTQWIHRVRCRRLRFYYCPRAFVHQMNMVERFLPEKAEIESFFVPYYSETSGEASFVLFTKFLEYKKIGGELHLKPPEIFDSMGNKMEMDVFRDQYFRFLAKYY